MFSKALLIFSLISVAFATVEITTPVASTIYSGGQKDATVVWTDDNNDPKLAAFGPASISIYVGNINQQTSLQTLKDNVDVSTTTTITFTVDASIGPNSGEYFIRIQSLSLKDAKGQPEQAFSHKFTLNNMSGNFSSSILAEISGQSTAPLAGQTSSAASSAATTSSKASSASLTASSTSKNPSSTSSTTSATAKPSGGAMGLKAGWAGIVFGAVLGVTMF